MSLTVNVSFKPQNIESQSLAYFRELIRGGVDGMNDFWQLLKHPVDHCLYPASLFLHDCVIISSANMPDEKFCSSALKDSRLYAEAYRRMEMRVDSFKEAGIDFKLASGPKKVHMISRLAVNILLPGTILKGAKYLKSVKLNYEKFGVLKSPDIFEPLITYDLPLDRPLFKSYNASNIPSNGRFIYVITTDGKLHVAACNLIEPVRLPGGYYSISLRHHELAKAQPVVAAGQVVTTKKRLIERIDNASGHYQPRGAHLKPLVESVFEMHGYKGTQGAFQHQSGSLKAPCPNVIPKSPLLPLLLERSIQAACLTRVMIEKSLDFQDYPLSNPIDYVQRHRSDPVLTKEKAFRRLLDDAASMIRVVKPQKDETKKEKKEVLPFRLITRSKVEKAETSFSIENVKGGFKPSIVEDLYPSLERKRPHLADRIGRLFIDSSDGIRLSTKEHNLDWKMTPMPPSSSLSFRHKIPTKEFLGPNYLGPKRP
jgi:hypothetical protein